MPRTITSIPLLPQNCWHWQKSAQFLWSFDDLSMSQAFICRNVGESSRDKEKIGIFHKTKTKVVHQKRVFQARRVRDSHPAWEEEVRPPPGDDRLHGQVHRRAGQGHRGPRLVDFIPCFQLQLSPLWTKRYTTRETPPPSKAWEPRGDY